MLCGSGPKAADFNGDGIIDPFDYEVFLWLTGPDAHDVNGDSTIDFLDFELDFDLDFGGELPFPGAGPFSPDPFVYVVFL